MKTLFENIKAFLKWAGTTVEDKAGSVSSKRLGFYFSLWMLKVMITMPGATSELVWPLIALIAGLAGLTLPEWFSKLKNSNNEALPNDN